MSLNLNLSPFAETVMDIDGNVYKTVEVGNQTWMAENLRATSCNDGTPIAQVKDQSIWVKTHTPAYSWGSFTTVEKKKQYGAFYNAYVAQQGCNVCPKGWHVPTQPEYQQLLEGLVPGAQIKLSNPQLWPGGTVADNSSGWSAVPAGGLGGDVPGAYDFNKYAYFWARLPLGWWRLFVCNPCV
ncbi:MAG: fibrobacter succinogenes major paralogous domain-containing protein [Bacteroidia bacterium]